MAKSIRYTYDDAVDIGVQCAVRNDMQLRADKKARSVRKDLDEAAAFFGNGFNVIISQPDTE